MQYWSKTQCWNNGPKIKHKERIILVIHLKLLASVCFFPRCNLHMYCFISSTDSKMTASACLTLLMLQFIVAEINCRNTALRKVGQAKIQPIVAPISCLFTWPQTSVPFQTAGLCFWHVNLSHFPNVKDPGLVTYLQNTFQRYSTLRLN